MSALRRMVSGQPITIAPDDLLSQRHYCVAGRFILRARIVNLSGRIFS
ncbi:hypothetical protein [Roseovarius marisflavi]|nr:hypothetical protein [Roseovarius marisflavi]